MIYLLEDDENIRNFVIYALNNSGLEAKGFENAYPVHSGKAFQSRHQNLVILDIMLPEERRDQCAKKAESICRNEKSADHDVDR